MLVPFHQMPDNFQINEDEATRRLRLHHDSIPLREGEFIITKDDPYAQDWYVAEISRALADRIEVNYYTTVALPLEDYGSQSVSARTRRSADTSWLRTWCLQMGGHKATTRPPTQASRLAKDVYSGQIPLREVHQHILIRDVKLDALGVINAATTRLAVALTIPHHAGAGGEDDFL